MNERYIRGTKRDANGKPICKVCGKSLPPRRRAYCSDECWCRNTPSIMRDQVFARDRGICALCGLDTAKLTRKYLGNSHYWEADHIVPVSEGGGLCGLEGYRTLCKGVGTNNCHGKVSGELRKRLNERKRIEKRQRESGRLF